MPSDLEVLKIARELRTAVQGRERVTVREMMNALVFPDYARMYEAFTMLRGEALLSSSRGSRYWHVIKREVPR